MKVNKYPQIGTRIIKLHLSLAKLSNMLELNEIRIGSWIRFKETDSVDGEFQIKDKISRKEPIDGGEWFIDGQWHISMLDGIPINERWLKKMGFETSKITDRYSRYFNGTLLEFFSGNIILPLGTHDDIVLTRQKIIYVHQLQNLVFDLTGQ
jgi:hypothetical protein